MQGYANAIDAVVPTNGSVAISVIRFAQTATIVRALTEINSTTDRTALSSFFLGLSQSGDGSLTCISCGIFQAESTFTGSAIRAIIDVSTDGFNNIGPNPAGPSTTVGTSRWAVDVGRADVVNALGIGISTPPDFAYGTGSFSLLAPNFAAFESILTEKLRRETTVPEPGSLALLSLGLLGLGFLRRRRT